MTTSKKDHDGFFKEMFNDKRVYIPFLKTFVDADIVDEIDFDTISLTPQTIACLVFLQARSKFQFQQQHATTMAESSYNARRG